MKKHLEVIVSPDARKTAIARQDALPYFRGCYDKGFPPEDEYLFEQGRGLAGVAEEDSGLGRSVPYNFEHPRPVIGRPRKRIRQPGVDFKTFREKNLPLIESDFDIDSILEKSSDDDEKRRLLLKSLYEAKVNGVRLIKGYENFDLRKLEAYALELRQKVFDYAEVQFAYPRPAYVGE